MTRSRDGGPSLRLELALQSTAKESGLRALFLQRHALTTPATSAGISVVLPNHCVSASLLRARLPRSRQLPQLPAPETLVGVERSDGPRRGAGTPRRLVTQGRAKGGPTPSAQGRRTKAALSGATSRSCRG